MLDVLKVLSAAGESTQHIRSWNMMAALPHPRGNAFQRERGSRDLEVDDLDVISGGSHSLEPIHIPYSAKGAFKRKVQLVCDEPVDFTEYPARSSHGGQFRTQR